MHNWKCGYCFCGVFGRGDHFRFGSIFIKKSNQTKIFFKKNRNRTETGSNWPVSVRYFRAKTVRFFRFWLGFLCFGSVFSVWLGFSGFFRFFVGFGSVRFFRFFGYKTETEPAGFFKNLIGLIGFFFRFGFFGYFFSGFLGLIGFPVFLLTPTNEYVSLCSSEYVLLLSYN